MWAALRWDYERRTCDHSSDASNRSVRNDDCFYRRLNARIIKEASAARRRLCGWPLLALLHGGKKQNHQHEQSQQYNDASHQVFLRESH